ncbi:OadG family protein [Methylocaldum szegediense]|jgi:oxaloacetate decarboxylase gamma subunit|uniref:Probable oxaloacetate decarboxylase gamma chain n=1 Tax=Methylocaldum szegediense TaxID=73780 RepID=A0ABN8WZ20_9GAMM|nr:OadG family protein [Methylocaldum szegediense]CAI8758851.1 putative oxaloacetate decarboxylase gamma chain [Methylocaldum szegediense]
MDYSIGELLLSGVKIMLVGMAIVYLFLALLVWVIGITSKLLNRYVPEPEHAPGASAHPPDVDSDNSEIVAAITAAIHRYQNQ